MPASKKAQPEENIGWLDILSGGAMEKLERQQNAKSERRILALMLWGIAAITGFLAVVLGIPQLSG
ncbi:hypothetical protein [Mycolicibacterium diernhoferi]|uniref:Uncharacterized protein n=1 Tax=Mycolicibacterium diernhoferi TaxID=1801 RepID=A0A1Q4H920_9MYCO|nr:hypothetical protein [Mycolicibacterium diernhoferi]OJZ64038.1 hypothetical protein BRW64_20140 [Mycolicibacterium diernhoferi]OPE53768.1 hypothetical protein BV510_13870 [Mycolicibacterium diernhoferi]PEG55576.1 hypothetical protein CRI78_04745 [Mycolicibacterium diernhoferi]QYL20726.1 hypothetical protein K0O62_16760 [Mycolicibacterium diernhoferi]